MKVSSRRVHHLGGGLVPGIKSQSEGLEIDHLLRLRIRGWILLKSVQGLQGGPGRRDHSRTKLVRLRGGLGFGKNVRPSFCSLVSHPPCNVEILQFFARNPACRNMNRFPFPDTGNQHLVPR